MQLMTLAGAAVDLALSFAIPVAALLVLVTIIVFFHEYGHFSVARLLGVRIDVFSIGFGKPIARWRDSKGTEWRIAWIPLGGFVKFFGDANAASQRDPALDEETDEAGPATTQFPQPNATRRGLTPEEKKVCFHYKPVWARAAIVAAGPMANFVLAAAIFWGLLMALGDVVWQPRISMVEEGSAAHEAGFEPGDTIRSINGRAVRDFDDVAMAAKLNAGERLVIVVDRGGELVSLEATPRREEMPDAFGNTVSAGKLGIAPDPEARAFVRYGPVEALGHACGKVWSILSGTVKFVGRLVLGKEDANQLGGPVRLAQYAGQAATIGFSDTGAAEPPGLGERLQASLWTFINFAAIVSVSIGFLNLLPVPVLDGGHLMYYAYEAVAGKPLGARAQAIGFKVGIVLLASLMLFVTWNDITNPLTGTN